MDCLVLSSIGACVAQAGTKQEGVVVADLQDVEADSEAVKKRAEFGYQRAEENKPEVPVEKYIGSFRGVSVQGLRSPSTGLTGSCPSAGSAGIRYFRRLWCRKSQRQWSFPRLP